MGYKFNPFTSTLDLTSSGSGSTTNSFSTIAVPAGTSPTAASATDTLTLTSSDQSVVITGNSSTDTVDFKVNSISNFSLIMEDFIIGALPGTASSQNSGSGAFARSNGAASTSTHPGVWMFNTGTTTSGYAGLYGSNQDQVLNPAAGGYQFLYEVCVQVPVLSNGTDTFIINMGFTDNAFQGNVVPNHGIYFQYTHNVAGGNWTLNATASNVTTTRDTAIPVVANSWYKLTYVVNNAGTSIQAFVNDVSAGAAITTNIPTAKQMFDFQLYKTAGTTAMAVNLDYYKIAITLMTPR